MKTLFGSFQRNSSALVFLFKLDGKAVGQSIYEADLAKNSCILQVQLSGSSVFSVLTLHTSRECEFTTLANHRFSSLARLCSAFLYSLNAPHGLCNNNLWLMPFPTLLVGPERFCETGFDESRLCRILPDVHNSLWAKPSVIDCQVGSNSGLGRQDVDSRQQWAKVLTELKCFSPLPSFEQNADQSVSTDRLDPHEWW